MRDRMQGMGRPTINDRPSADRGTSAVAPPRPLVVKVTPYPVHPMSKSEGYNCEPFSTTFSALPNVLFIVDNKFPLPSPFSINASITGPLSGRNVAETEGYFKEQP